MLIQLAIDEQLLTEAKQLGQHPTQEAAIMAALQEYIQRHKQLQIVQLFGQIDYDPDYDYKAQRKQS